MRATGGSVSKTRREMWRAYIFSRYTRDVHAGEKAFEWKGNKKKKKEGGGEGRDFTWRNTRLSVRDICFKPVPSEDRYFSCRIRLENIIDFEYLREILSSINPLYSGTRVTHWLCSINFDTLRNVEAEKTFFEGRGEEVLKNIRCEYFYFLYEIVE